MTGGRKPDHKRKRFCIIQGGRLCIEQTRNYMFDRIFRIRENNSAVKAFGDIERTSDWDYPE